MLSRRYLAALLLLLTPAWSWSQDIRLGNNLTADQIAAAQKKVADLNELIKSAKSREFQLNVGDYLTVDPPDSIKGDLLWLVTDESLLKQVTIKPQTAFATFLRHAGATEASYQEFPARAVAWYMLVGLKEGRTVITIIVNGEAGKAPVVLDKLDITVGRPKPPPPPPDADPLLKAAAADMNAGKGKAEDLDFFRNYLTTWAAALPGTVQYKTSKDFWLAFQAGRQTGMGDSLPTLRDAVGKVLDQQVPEKEGDSFDAARRNQLATALKAIAARLENK